MQCSYRVFVHFATHGLLAGESKEILKAKAEPGLILTPPDKASKVDDGLLTASEITLLKLDADWVILSACNTAGGGSEGAQALSGLARAFFYAGTRSLLVSHWAVYSDATVKLSTGALSQMAQNKEIGRSEALRRAMMELLENGEPHEAHPSFWAPFVLVGEGAPANRSAETVELARGRMGLGLVEDAEASDNSTLDEEVTNANEAPTELNEATSEVVPLPKRRPRRVRRSQKSFSVNRETSNWTTNFWQLGAHK